MYPVDKSGSGNHMEGEFQSGPGVGGRGGSLDLDASSDIVIPATESLRSKTLTVAFWIYLKKHSTGRYRNILRKGGSSSEVTPSLMFDMTKRSIIAHVSTSAHVDEGPRSMGQIPLKRWTHVAMTVSHETLKLYINGVLDTAWPLNGPIVTNNGNIYVGKNIHQHGAEAYLDDLRLYNVAISADQVHALISPSVTGLMNYDYATVGCQSCTFQEALRSCPTSRHLCHLIEVQTTVYHQARITGTVDDDEGLWFQELQNGNPAGKRCGYCCQDSTYNIATE
eukprot:Filipodium_phascolosomae@DN7967_c0_g1_i1.p1